MDIEFGAWDDAGGGPGGHEVVLGVCPEVLREEGVDGRDVELKRTEYNGMLLLLP